MGTGYDKLMVVNSFSKIFRLRLALHPSTLQYFILAYVELGVDPSKIVFRVICWDILVHFNGVGLRKMIMRC